MYDLLPALIPSIPAIHFKTCICGNSIGSFLYTMTLTCKQKGYITMYSALLTLVIGDDYKMVTYNLTNGICAQKCSNVDFDQWMCVEGLLSYSTLGGSL